MKRIALIDGNNQFFINYSRAINYEDLKRRCFELHNSFDTVFWVFDGYDSRKPRRDLLPSYKDTAARNKSKLDTGKYDLLKQFKNVDLPENGGVLIVERPHTEADDLIRKLAQLMANDQTYIEVLSNDVDLLNLSYLPNVKQPQAKLPDFVTTAWELDLYKTLVGDSADNIKGLQTFGPKSWQSLTTEQRQNLYSMFKNGAECFDNSSGIFPEETKKQSKLVKLLTENWANLMICWKVVNYIEIPDDEVMQFVRTYPKLKVEQQQPKLMTM